VKQAEAAVSCGPKDYPIPGVQLSHGASHANKIHVMTFMLDLLALAGIYRIAPLIGSLGDILKISPSENFPMAAEIHEVVVFCLSLATLFFLYINGHYSQRIPWWTQIQDISKIIAFDLIVDGLSNFILGLSYPPLLFIASWLTGFGLLIVVRSVIDRIKCGWEGWKIPAAVIADADTATDTLFALASDRGMGLTAHAIILQNRNTALDRDELPASYRNIKILTEGGNCEEYIIRNPDLFYIISLDSFDGANRDRLIRLLRQHDIHFALLPAITRMGTNMSEPRYFFGNDIMLLHPQKPAARQLSLFIKRTIDITGAVAALTVFMVPMLLVALMQKLEGQGGSVLYAGLRVGQDGRLFRCWKFRSMEPGTDHLLQEYLEKNPQAKAHWKRYFKLPDDPRVQTRTSRFIRKASIDELPQLWNVLKGDMSLVGPRPILESEIPFYGERIDEYTSVKPGLTGLWQVSGRNGTSFQRRVVWDSWYVRNWTLWGDIIIILKTIQVVLNRSGAS
jgi:undecaprenyl-phosphate galactose phosphotransferase